MTRLQRLTTGAALLLLFTSAASAQTSLSAVTVIFSETWTGNAYRPPYIDVTGSEAVPVDFYLGAGARLELIRPFLYPGGALVLDPRLTLNARRHLLFASGRVVPTQQETSLGADENSDPGLGSARVLTFAIAVPVGLEFGLSDRAVIALGLSPTLLLRVNAGDVEYLVEPADLRGNYAFFYGRLRWLRPEFHLEGRFVVSERMSFAVRSTVSASMLDLFEPTFPAWDLMRVTGGIELSLSPPLRAVFGLPVRQRPAPEPTAPEQE